MKSIVLLNEINVCLNECEWLLCHSIKQTAFDGNKDSIAAKLNEFRFDLMLQMLYDWCIVC